MPDTGPVIDFTRLWFPTDAITIGDLRKKFPFAFEGVDPDYFNEGDDNMSALVECERTVAQWAFDKALGRPTPSADEWRDQEEGLEITYTEMELAKGAKHAEQLVRDLKEAAAAQAREYLGKII
jgi:hypothetical protein